MTMQTDKWSADDLYLKLKDVQVDNPACLYSLERCERLVPTVNRILELKKQRNALILAHSYVHPDIIYTVADHVGDSYGLALKAMEATESTIVFPSVRFMAETAKILNPDKLVIDPNPNGGCSLADSITAEDVLALRKSHPEHTFMCYINTTAAVKAACDVCVTSSNVYKIVEEYPNDKIYFVPDKLMGLNIREHLRQKGIKKEILLYDGTCYVHEQFTPELIDIAKEFHPNTVVLAHPECTPEVLAKADVVGSTTGMANYVKEHAKDNNRFLLLTECGLVSRLQIEVPEAKMAGTCMLCKYMKSNTLGQLERALRDPRPDDIVEVEEDVRKGAKNCLEEMFKYS
ncbi:MAG: quinolinate synthase [Chlamydiales bacterium]|jgi:quinolinate synthase